jgi:anti-anti-sigma factor
MQLQRRERDNIVIFDLRGNFRRPSNIPLHQEVKEQLGAGRRNFLLNFMNLKSMDSCGVGELIASLHSIHYSGGKLKITNMPSVIRYIFKITALETVFEIFEDEETAINSYS